MLVELLGTWASKYKDESGMRALASLFELGRSKLGQPRRVRSGSLAQKSSAPSSPTEPVPTTAPRIPQPPPVKEQKRRSMPAPVKQPRPAETTATSKTKPRSSSTSTSTAGGSNAAHTFNFATAKPKIIQEVALANQNANNLVNALRLINTTEDRWEIDLQHDARLQDYRQKCEESKKKIVRYARLVEDEEWIGTLLATNEELLKALEMYELMSIGEVPTNLPSPGSAPQSPTSPAHVRLPPPPPLPAQQPLRYQQEETIQALSGLRLSPQPTAESSYSHQSEESLDPFADPVAPLEDIPNERQSRT